eukprot:scaffold3394_cov385-Prasinococcus_capsulatus_cf.AAC.17
MRALRSADRARGPRSSSAACRRSSILPPALTARSSSAARAAPAEPRSPADGMRWAWAWAADSMAARLASPRLGSIACQPALVVPPPARARSLSLWVVAAQPPRRRRRQEEEQQQLQQQPPSAAGSWLGKANQGRRRARAAPILQAA